MQSLLSDSVLRDLHTEIQRALVYTSVCRHTVSPASAYRCSSRAFLSCIVRVQLTSCVTSLTACTAASASSTATDSESARVISTATTFGNVLVIISLFIYLIIFCSSWILNEYYRTSDHQAIRVDCTIIVTFCQQLYSTPVHFTFA